ncbi:MAG: ABC transporter substrate-binding protein [Promethearchaeota archaeon]
MANKNKILTGLVIIVTVVITGFVGYTFYDQYVVDQNQPTSWVYVDSHNRSVTVPQSPQRIISMAPSVTEIIYALGAEDRLVGRTDFCDYPEAVLNITSIGGFSTPSLEIITALDPDIIIAATWNAESVAILEDANITIVIVDQIDTILHVIDGIEDIGKLIASEANATIVVNDMRASYWNIANQTAAIPVEDKLRCYFEIWETPMVAGNVSYLHDMMTSAGGINLFENLSGTYPAVSNENIINGNPNVIFVTEHSAAWYSQEICNRTGYAVLDACVNERIYLVGDNLFLRAGPRIIDALGIMTTLLYPTLLE